MSSIYHINKGINRSVEFKGLKSQYIWYMGGGIVVLMGIFCLLYLIGLNDFLCILLVGAGAAALVVKVYGMSNKYGEHGLMKKLAQRSIPKIVKVRSRWAFTVLNETKSTGCVRIVGRKIR